MSSGPAPTGALLQGGAGPEAGGAPGERRRVASLGPSHLNTARLLGAGERPAAARP